MSLKDECQAELERLLPAHFDKVVFRMGVKQGDLVGSQSQKAIQLVNWAELDRQNPKLPELARAIRAVRAADVEIHLPSAGDFDLQQLVDDCMVPVLQRNGGLLGIAVASDPDALLDPLCERLRHEIGREFVTLRSRLTVGPKIGTVDRAASSVRGYVKELAYKHVLCPVQVFASSRAAARGLNDSFWAGVARDFPAGQARLLLVVMVGEHADSFPPAVVQTGPPRLTIAHTRSWIRRVVEALQWPHELIDKWNLLVQARCAPEGQLEVTLVYQHLASTLCCLGRGPTHDEFLRELDNL